MNILNAFFICQVTKTPIKIGELWKANRSVNNFDSYIQAIVTLNKANITYSRELLNKCYLEGRNVRNISFGLVAAKKRKIELSLTEAIQKDKEKIDLLEMYSKNE